MIHVLPTCGNICIDSITCIDHAIFIDHTNCIDRITCFDHTTSIDRIICIDRTTCINRINCTDCIIGTLTHVSLLLTTLRGSKLTVLNVLGH